MGFILSFIFLFLGSGLRFSVLVWFCTGAGFHGSSSAAGLGIFCLFFLSEIAGFGRFPVAGFAGILGDVWLFISAVTGISAAAGCCANQFLQHHFPHIGAAAHGFVDHPAVFRFPPLEQGSLQLFFPVIGSGIHGISGKGVDAGIVHDSRGGTGGLVDSSVAKGVLITFLLISEKLLFTGS